MSRLTVLSVAYPFAPVTADPVGGGEQILARLDRALVANGDRSVVMAVEGSQVAGDLAPLPGTGGALTEAARRRGREGLRRALAEVIETLRPDVVHLHGIDFADYLPPPGPPVVVTLHLPLDWYDPAALRPERPNTWLAPVSADQAARAPIGARLLDPIENGVDVQAFEPERKRRFVLAMGRICPEKGFHHALDAARAAGLSMLLAGQVFAYPEHRAYFDGEIAPRLDRRRRWLGPVTDAPKRRLLGAARALLVPSLAPETSCLVAREAMAAGTPVIAFDRGALSEVIDDGRTGFLVDDADGMAEALGGVGALDPEACRRTARERFSAEAMTGAYLALYRRLADGGEPARGG